jgi:hypothetical protein
MIRHDLLLRDGDCSIIEKRNEIDMSADDPVGANGKSTETQRDGDG